MLLFLLFMSFFFFRHMTAYEVRISDWSSDVCFSDLSDAELWYVEPTIQFGPPNDLKARLNGVKQVHVTSDRGTGFWKAWLALEPRRPLDARIVRAAKTIDRLIEAGPVRLADAARESDLRSEEHTSELQSLMRISYAVFCLKKKKTHTNIAKSNSHVERYLTDST